MKKIKVYLDTSIPSFLFASDSPEKQEITIQFWKLLRLGVYEPIISDIVLQEILASWNFKHIVKLKTIFGVNGINQMLGYSEIKILTPQSLIGENYE